MSVAGIDVGAGRTKAVVLDAGGAVTGTGECRTRLPFDEAAREALRLAGGREEDIEYTAATGLGRHSLSFHDIAITEITCGARGGARLDPAAKFVLDVGSQCTRAVKLREGGRVADFQTNEKCAAGSGSFLERVARYLEVPLDGMGDLSINARASKPISSICAVLAESEIINHVSEGVAVADIVRGVHDSLAGRSLAQLKRIGLDGPVLVIGGVTRQRGMVEACRRLFGVPVTVHEMSPYVVALGAAVLGMQRLARVGARTR